MSKDSNKRLILNDPNIPVEGRKSQLSGKSGGGLSSGGLISGNPTINNNRNANTNLGNQYPQTDKMKRNGRKLNSGIPAKILIGRQGQNVVI